MTSIKQKNKIKRKKSYNFINNNFRTYISKDKDFFDVFKKPLNKKVEESNDFKKRNMSVGLFQNNFEKNKFLIIKENTRRYSVDIKKTKFDEITIKKNNSVKSFKIYNKYSFNKINVGNKRNNSSTFINSKINSQKRNIFELSNIKYNNHNDYSKIKKSSISLLMKKYKRSNSQKLHIKKWISFNYIQNYFSITNNNLKRDLSHKIIKKLNTKNKIIVPYFYSFENYLLKENIFLLGGVKNILPLFDIMYNLYKKDDKRMINIFSKIIEILESIFSFENNIEDAINSKFFDIFSIFIEKITENNKDLFPKMSNLIEKLIKSKFHADKIYLSLKELILNKNIMINIKDKDLFLDFLFNLKQYKDDNFYYLLTIIIKNKDIDEDFFNKIFEAFLKLLNEESIEKINNLVKKKFFDDIDNIEKINFEKIGEICLLMNEDDIDDKIIIKSLNLIIDILNIKIDKKIIEDKLISQQKSILKSFNLYTELKDQKESSHGEIQEPQNFISLMEKKDQNIEITELEKILIRNIGILNYLINNKLMYFSVKLSNSKNIDIKFKLFDLFQVIFYYYVNTCGKLSIYNYYNLLYELERKEMGLTQEELIKKLIKIEGSNKTLKLNNLNQKINNKIYNQLKIFPKNNNNNNEYGEITSYFIQLLTIGLDLKFDKNDENNLSSYSPQILSFIKNFLSLVINSHFFF